MDDLQKRYMDAAHGMQTGVAALMEHDPAETTPKHLRVGINSAMVETGTLVELLVSKGVFTLDEFKEALAFNMEVERDSYADKLSAILGKRVILG